MSTNNKYNGFEVAVIGMACRFPAANTWRGFWQNLVDAKECFRQLTEEELRERGADEAILNDPDFIRSVPDLQGKETFDAAFFDYTPDEATLLGPQNRLFHECIWEAFEDAGYVPEKVKGLIGLYGSASNDMNWRVYAKLINREQRISDFLLKHISDKDFLPPMISYKLNLKGASINLSSACSSSLTGIHLASRALIFGEVNLAVAGGVFLDTDQQYGYRYEEGSILSKDGHCRAFDEQSSGTIIGEGAGVVVLKRLADAIKDRDHIYAIIKGSAVNNDGGRKIGLTAPSVEGQAECIKLARRFARVAPESIQFVETHGTGTALGDTIEIAGLNAAFKDIKHPISVGSVKTNIGHLDTAAGVAGFMKAALSLKHRTFPPSLHFVKPNPMIDFASGPFQVANTCEDLTRRDDHPLRGAVSSLGVGGTNAHAVLEEAPPLKEDALPSRPELFTLSARSKESLLRYVDKLIAFLEKEEQLETRHAAYTYQVGRKHFSNRLPLVAANRDELLQQLRQVVSQPKGIAAAKNSREVVFLFPGQGAQYVNMGRGLYDALPVFRAQMDEGFALLEKWTGLDFKDIVYPKEEAQHDINETRYAQPLIYLFEYALACQMTALGVKPHYMIGHSIGEYAAATMSGVMSFKDALRLLVKRGELIFDLPGGDMLSVGASEQEVLAYLIKGVDVAAVNGPTQTVLSGEPAAIAVVEKSLKEKEIMCKILRTSHAFHSAMLDPVLDSFRQEVEKVKLQRGQVPFVSNLSGQLITAEEAQNPDYWVRHMRHAVRFLDGMSGLLERSKKSVLIELGPGRVLSGLTRQLRQDGQIPLCINTIRSIKNKVADERFYTESLGKIWASGIALNWEAVHQDRPCRRVSLPTYAFDPIAYPTIIDPFKMLTGGAIGTKAHSTLRKDWLYRPYWKSSFWLPNNGEQESPSSVLIFADRGGLASKLAKECQQDNVTCTQVWTGEQFEKTEEGYLINPSNGQDYRLLFESLASNKQLPQQIFHCWTFEAVERKNGHRKKEDHYRNLGYHSLQHIARNLSTDSIRIEVMSNRALAVQAGESVQVEKGTLLGVVKVLPLEFPFVQCRLIDVEDLTERNFIGLKKEIHQSVSEQFVALRNGSRYVQDLEAVSFAQPETFQQLCKGGTYLITGAMGGVGRTLTEYLLDVYQANLILLSRRPADDKYLSALQTKGGQVVYLSADVSEEADWKTQLREAVQKLGAIQGVIHAAGLADKAGVILRRSEAAEEALFRAKINGLDNLLNFVKDMPLDFFLACSSQSTLFPDLGQVGAVASNAYLDAHASKTSYPFPYISMGWETISDVGLATDFIAQLKEPEQSQLLKDCIQSSDLPELLELALHLQMPHILVGKKDLVQELHTVADPGQAEELDDGFDNFVLQKVARPDLSSAYQEPQTETEEELVELLENFFGIEGIGREDDIFELGADSLKIMVVNKRISKHFGVELSLQEFYDHPLIRSIAREIATAAKIVQMQQEEKPSNVITEIII